MTISMCVRNAIRLYENNRGTYEEKMKSATRSEWQHYGEVVEPAAA